MTGNGGGILGTPKVAIYQNVIYNICDPLGDNHIIFRFSQMGDDARANRNLICFISIPKLDG